MHVSQSWPETALGGLKDQGPLGYLVLRAQESGKGTMTLGYCSSRWLSTPLAGEVLQEPHSPSARRRPGPYFAQARGLHDSGWVESSLRLTRTRLSRRRDRSISLSLRDFSLGAWRHDGTSCLSLRYKQFYVCLLMKAISMYVMDCICLAT